MGHIWWRWSRANMQWTLWLQFKSYYAFNEYFIRMRIRYRRVKKWDGSALLFFYSSRI